MIAVLAVLAVATCNHQAEQARRAADTAPSIPARPPALDRAAREKCAAQLARAADQGVIVERIGNEVRIDRAVWGLMQRQAQAGLIDAVACAEHGLTIPDLGSDQTVRILDAHSGERIGGAYGGQIYLY